MNRPRSPFFLRLIAPALLLACFLLPLRAIAQSDGDSPFTFEHLANATYLSEFGADGTVTLVDGRYEAPAAEGSASDLAVELSEFVSEGDLDGDGVDEAAVVLVSSGGGSGSFYQLAVVAASSDGLVNVATAPLGDRVKIISFTVEDGAVAVNMLTQGPDDPMCCPSNEVLRIYRLDGDELLLASETEFGAQEPETPALEPDTDPTTALLRLGGGEGRWLDPMLVGVMSGVAAGGESVDAASLDAECVGTLPATPDVVVEWTPDANVTTLRFFTLSAGDPVLAVVTPAGELLCGDDFSPLDLNPLLEVSAPAAGRYAIFVGAQEAQPAAPALLVITGGDADPATFALGQLFARHVPTDEAAAERAKLAAAEALTLDDGPEPIEIAAGDAPLTATVEAGGDLAAFELELGNALCTGWVSAEPAARFAWSGEGEALNLFVESEIDTTLLVRTPDGAWLCADDGMPALADDEVDAEDADNAEASEPNLNPQIVTEPVEGVYAVWVGAFAAEDAAEATLTVSDDTALLPATLVAE